MMKNIQMRAMPLLFSLHFPSFVLSFVHGLQNPVGGQTPPDSMALFYALFPKSRVFLGCLLGYYCIQCLPGVADMSKRKLKAASGSYAVLNTRRFLFQRVQFRQRRSCIMEMALIFNEFIFTPVTHQNSLWIRSSELAKALGYSDDRKVGVLYARHKDEFSNNMSVVLNLSTTDVPAMNRIFSLRGCHLVAMLARTPIAKAFRRWVLDVIEQYGDRVPVAEPVTLNDELISAAERAELKLIVDAKLSTYPAAVQGKARAEIWAKFNRHFRIAEYKQLPTRLMPEAREFLLSVRVRAINAIPTAESAIPYPALPASSVYAARIAALDRLEEEWIEFAGETRSRLHRFVNELLRVKESTYPELLNRVCSQQNISKDPLLGILQSNSYNAQTWIDAGISEMRAAIRAAKTANRLMLG